MKYLSWLLFFLTFAFALLDIMTDEQQYLFLGILSFVLWCAITFLTIRFRKRKKTSKSKKTEQSIRV